MELPPLPTSCSASASLCTGSVIAIDKIDSCEAECARPLPRSFAPPAALSAWLCRKGPSPASCRASWQARSKSRRESAHSASPCSTAASPPCMSHCTAVHESLLSATASTQAPVAPFCPLPTATGLVLKERKTVYKYWVQITRLRLGTVREHDSAQDRVYFLVLNSPAGHEGHADCGTKYQFEQSEGHTDHGTK